MTTAGTSNMVSSSDVNGTEVYGRDGAHIGSIDHLMIDKESGRVAYAVMGFGGFLGLGEDHYPVPWDKLTYDTQKQGFVTDITADQVEGAPARTDDWQGNREWERQTYAYYNVAPYWV